MVCDISFNRRSVNNKVYLSKENKRCLSVRKGKIKQLFDLELTISFTAELLKDSKEKSKIIEGKISVPEFAWDSEPNEIQVLKICNLYYNSL